MKIPPPASPSGASAPECGDACTCGDAHGLERHLDRRLPAAILAVGLVLAAALLRGPLGEIRTGARTLTATGSAIRPVSADLFVWKFRVKAQAADLSSAFAAHERAAGRVRAFLAERDAASLSLRVGALQPMALKKQWNDVEVSGYELTQEFEVTTVEIDSGLALVKDSARLLQEGLFIEPEPPQFHVTGLDRLKFEMLGAAVENAKARAEAVAAAGGVRVGAPRSVRIGVFQVRPVRSTEVSDAGMLDTSSREKEAMAVVTVGFEIR